MFQETSFSSLIRYLYIHYTGKKFPSLQPVVVTRRYFKKFRLQNSQNPSTNRNLQTRNVNNLAKHEPKVLRDTFIT